MIEVKGLSHAFLASGSVTVALQDIDLTVADGEFVALVGPSGCGKTTLLNIIAGLEHHTEPGTVTVNGQEPTIGDPTVGYMLARDCLLPWRRALSNATLALEIQGLSRTERRRRAMEALASVGLESFVKSYPAQLSQGMRQRVALARVFACYPSLLLLDEPFSALDAQTRITVQDAFLDVWQRQRATVLLVTHDLSEAVALADRVVVMSRGPGRIKFSYVVDLPRPRSASRLRMDRRFHAAYDAVWAVLRDEVAAAEEHALSADAGGSDS